MGWPAWPDDVQEAETIACVLVRWVKAGVVPPDDAYAWARAVGSVLKPPDASAATATDRCEAATDVTV